MLLASLWRSVVLLTQSTWMMGGNSSTVIRWANKIGPVWGKDTWKHTAGKLCWWKGETFVYFRTGTLASVITQSFVTPATTSACSHWLICAYHSNNCPNYTDGKTVATFMQQRCDITRCHGRTLLLARLWMRGIVLNLLQVKSGSNHYVWKTEDKYCAITFLQH